jgi:opacity protein-like surface antigen
LVAALLLAGAAAPASAAPAASPTPTATPAATPTSTSTLEIAAGVWSPTLGGTIGQGATNVSLTGTLNLPNDSSPAIDLDWHTGRSHWIVSYVGLANNATTNINTSFFYNNQLFTFGNVVASSIQFNDLTVGWEPRIAGGNTDRAAELDALVMVDILNINTNLRDLNTTANASANYTAPVPLLGLAGQIPLGNAFDFYGRAGFLSANVSGINGSVFDYRAGIKWNFTHNWLVDVDYRGFSFNGHDGHSNNGNLQYGGPTFELGAKF